jgi:hypothetical protein
MPTAQRRTLTPTVVDLPSLSINLPPAPQPEILRASTLNTLKTYVQDKVYAVAIEGVEGSGKTTVLSQFVRRNSSNAISVFISAANRFSYDAELIRQNITNQVYFAATGNMLNRDKYDPALLKTYCLELQQLVKRRKSLMYFVVDGIDELEKSSRDSLLQQLTDILPIGIPQFKFLFSGDESLYRGLVTSKLPIKSFPLTEFSPDETRALFKAHEMSIETADEINNACRGLPGRLATVLRSIERGTDPSEFLRDAPTRWPEIFEIDWRQVNPSDNDLLRILALLSQDSRPHTVQDVSTLFGVEECVILNRLSTVNFLFIDSTTRQIHFANPGLRRYIAERLKTKTQEIRKLLIRHLLSAPDSSDACLELPTYFEEAGDYGQLLDYLTSDHILQVLERSRTLAKVDDAVRRGFRSAKKLGRDQDLLRFSLQQSIISDLAHANVWESEVAALAALNRDPEALALANDAILREDRLEMLATLAHHIWIRGDSVPSELLEQISLLIDNLDFGSLGQRAAHIASSLVCVSPDLADSLLKKAKTTVDDTELDRTFLRFTVSALGDLRNEQRRDQALEAVVRSRQDPMSKGMLEGVRVLSGRLRPEDVCASSENIQATDARISVLKSWCVLNGSTPEADLVACHALKLAIATPETRIDANFLADLSQALAGSPDLDRKRALICMLDGVRATAERLGPSVSYVRLQLTIALNEAEFDQMAAESRLIEVISYVPIIGDLPSRGQSYAECLASLRRLSPLMRLASVDSFERQCASELESVVLTLSTSTADHYLALGGIIAGLAAGDLTKAIDYTCIVNTETRRDAILIDVIESLLRRSIVDIDLNGLSSVLRAIVALEQKDEGLLLIIERFANESEIPQSQAPALRAMISDLPTMTDSVLGCRGMVSGLRLLHRPAFDGDISLRSHLMSCLQRRWQEIDIGWVRIDAGYGMARDLAAFSSADAELILRETESMKKEWSIAAIRPASTFMACIRLLIRVFAGLMPRHLETEIDITAIASLIEILPSCGERAVLWADLAIRASLAERADLTESLVQNRLQPAFANVPREDRAYRSRVLVQIAPALYRAQSTTCLHELEFLDPDDRDVAIRQIIEFLIAGRAPFDPVDHVDSAIAEVKYETLLQVASLAERLNTDWMIYVTAREVANAVLSPKNKPNVTIPQRQHIGRHFTNLAKEKLPLARHIPHRGFQIVTLAQALRMVQAKPPEWLALIDDAKTLENVSDRAYVLQSIAMALPKNMWELQTKLILDVRQAISEIPWQLDQIERYLGLAEDLNGIDKNLCRELVNQAATVISSSSDDVRDQQRRLVDIAYRVDEELAQKLIDAFDDDEAKRRSQAQLRLLGVRKSVVETSGKPDEQKILSRVHSYEISKLGLILLKSFNAGRMQSFHPSHIRHYLDLVPGQPLSRAYPLLTWYVDNAVSRYRDTEQAATFLRPMFDACVVGVQLAGQIAGKALIRLKALKVHSGELSHNRSMIIRPRSQKEAARVLSGWFDKKLQGELLLHDPYFGPGDLHWLQIIRESKPRCRITIMTSRAHQPLPNPGESLEDLYAAAWQRAYDQAPPVAEIAIIGGENSKNSPIHDRWLVSGEFGLRLGTSLNSLGQSRESEISEMSAQDTDQKRIEMQQYLARERTEHNGEKLRLTRFWL